MSTPLFSLLQKYLSSHRFTKQRRKGRRPSAHTKLAFESLEARQLLSVTALQDFSASSNTGEKPQSKVWEYANEWYSVMPDSDGTWVWKLNGSQWQHQLQLSSSKDVNADVKVVGDLAHVLLYEGSQSQLATVQYDHGSDNRYEMWSLRPSLVDIALSGGVETATLEVDSIGRMWIASDAKSTVEVRYSDANSQYSNWSAPITVASGIGSDDISSIIAMPNGSIGVLWSNQSTDRFGFKLHQDGAAPTVWSADEVPASQSALKKGGGMADDHINLAVASNGTLYAAVKTSYDSSGYPRIALLVRRPSGVWDNLYQVDTKGTRPIVMLNEVARKLIVAYTASDSGGNIYYKESSMDNISFGPKLTLISGSLNNVSSVKATFTDEVVAIAAGGSKVKSVMFRFDVPAPNQQPVVNAGADQTIQLGATVNLDGTVTDDGKPTPASLATSWTILSGPNGASFGNAGAVDTTFQFSQEGTYVLQLKANDGQLEGTDTVTIVVQSPSNPVNQPPVVSAGSDQSITLPAGANLAGSVMDDDLPAPPSLTIGWSVVSAPTGGTVTFGNAASASTSAQFNIAGTYVLRLTANDGQYQTSSQVTITVAAAPTTTTSLTGTAKYTALRKSARRR
jgi:hypothetical protein